MDASPELLSKRRWPGLLLSFLVPGFGLIRAGMPWRGIGWFLGILLLSIVVGVSLGLSVVPVWLAGLVVAGALAAQIWMLRDGFRVGKMTWWLWLAFFVMFASLIALPNPALIVASSFRIPTGGMEPTFRGSGSSKGPDHLIVDKLNYRFSPPKRGDIIVFSTSRITALHKLTGNTRENFFIQRLVGMPGETIRFSEGKIYADGKLLGETDGVPPFSYGYPQRFRGAVMKEGEDFRVGADEYFVIGDNTANSLDSRYWGGVPTSSVIGKATLIYYPLSRIRRLPSR